MTVTIENTSVDTALNIAELTQGSLTGNGVFDVLLQTLRLHLDREFTSGRITGTAYATVYSQAITAFLQQAVQFCLSKAKLALELKNIEEQNNVLKLQQVKLNHEIAEISERIENIIPNQIAQMVAEKNRILQNTANMVLEGLNITKQGNLITVQISETEARIGLTEAQTDNANKQTDLYAQKIITETAQAQSTPASGSVMGVQNALMNKQKENYDRDAEQKAAKMLIDTWGIRYNDDPLSAVPNATNKLEDTSIGAAVDKLLTGIGVP